MESSFNLPNEVNSSNKRKSSKNNLEQNEMITGEYKRVNTASKRSNKDEQTGTKNDEPVWTENIDNVAGGAKTLAQHGTALKILKVVCVGVVVSTFISTAVFGGVIYNLVS